MRNVTVGMLVLSFLGCGSDAIKGSGSVVTIAHELSGDFSAIEVSPGLAVRITSGESPLITVTGDDNIVELFGANRVNSTLYLKLDSDETFAPTRRIEVTLDARRLNQITVEGSRMIVGPVASQSLSVVASDWAEIEIDDLPADSLSAVLSGGSTMTVNGNVDEQSYVLTEGSQLHAFGLTSSFTNVHVSDGSFAEVSAHEIIKVIATDDSEVVFDGEAIVESTLSDRAALIQMLSHHSRCSATE